MEEIYVTHIPKYPHTGGVLTFYGQTKEAKANSNALTDFLTAYAGAVGAAPIAGMPQSGELVLASIGQLWFRAEMIGFSNAYECTVRLIDYGSEEVVPLPNIRQASMLDNQLRNVIHNFHALANKYNLHGFRLHSEVLGDHQYVLVSKLMHKQVFRPQIIGQSADAVSVILLNEQGSIAELLSRYGIGSVVPALDVPPPMARVAAPRTPQTVQTPLRPQYLNMEFEKQKSYRVVVSYIELGPEKFTIQEAHSIDALNTLVERLSACQRLPPLRNHESGYPCAARSVADDKVYRGLIIKSDPRSSATVYYVDYGNKEVLSIDRVFELPGEFLSQRLFSIRCCLYGLESLTIDEDMKRRFEEVTDGKIMECKVKQLFPLEVALYFNGKNILELLTQPQANGRSTASTPISATPSLDTFEKLQIHPGFVGEVVVTNPASPAGFHVVQESALESIKSFEDFLNTPAQIRGLKNIPGSQMMAMTPCLATVGGSRYVRGLITEDPGEPVVEVRAVDNGLADTVPIDCIKQIKKEMIGIMPAQAIQCALSGFEDKVPSSDVVEEFRNLVSKKTLKMSVKKQIGSRLLVELTDTSSGQTISQILLAVLSFEQGGTQRGRAALSKPIGNPAPLTLNQVESVYVMLVYDDGRFFAQLERLSSEDLEKMQTELLTVYSANTNPQLLYADVKSHIGDFAVVKFPEDQAFYRAKITKEIAQDVEVLFLDYGNILTVDRSEVLKPVNLKLWTFQPFGQTFQFDTNVPQISNDDLSSFLMEKSIEVQIVRKEAAVAVCSLTESPKNQEVTAAMLHYKRNAPNPKGSVFSRLGGVAETSRQPEATQDRYQKQESRPPRKEPAQDGWGEDAPTRGPRGDQERKPKWEERPAPQSDSWNTQDKRPAAQAGGWDDQESRPAKSFEKAPRFQKSDGWGAGSGETSQPQYQPRERDNNRNWDNQRGGRGGGGGRFGGGGRGGREGGRTDGGKGWNATSGDDWGSSKPAASAQPTVSEDWGTPAAPPAPVKPVLKYKPINLPIGDSRKCQVVFVASPKEFYVQLEENIPDLDKLMVDLAEHFAKEVTPMSGVKANVVCGAKFLEDGAWYRGLIEKVDGGMATVYFVDYGNRQETEVGELRELNADHVRLPAQACKCALALVSAGEEVKDQFEEQTFEKSLTMIVVRKDKATRTFVVNLKEEEQNINSLYGAIAPEAPFSGSLPECSIGIGIPTNVFVSYYKTPDVFSLAELAKDEDYKTMSVDMNDFYYGLNESEMRLDSLTAGQLIAARFADDGQWNRACIETIAGDEVTVCFLDFGNKEIFKTPKDIRGLHPKFTLLPIRALPCKLKGIVVPESYKPGPVEAKLLAKSSLEAVVYEPSGGVHPVTLKSDGVDVATTLIEASILVKEPEKAPIDLITEALAGNLENLNSEVQVDDLVAAIFDEDGLYYRAKVTSLEDGKAAVLFIDYGNDSVVPVEDLKAIPDSVRAISPQLEEEAEVEVETTPAGGVATTAEPIDLITEALAGELVPLPGEVATGDLVAAIFDEDGLFYRAKVTSVDDGKAAVYFIDYGNEGIANVNELKAVPESVKSFPPQLEEEVAEVEAAPAQEEAASEGVAPIDLITEALAGELKPFNGEPQIGDMIAAVFEDDGLYYRAQIAAVSDDKVSVVFIDYGNTGLVLAADLKEIPESVRDFPPQLEPEVVSVEETVVEVKAKPVEATEETVTSPEVDNGQKIQDALAEELSPLKENLTEGSVVAAIFKDDGLYYRARVKSIQDNEAFVFFIDYGNEDTVDIADMREVPEMVRDIPALFKEEVVEAEEIKEAVPVISAEEDIDSLVYENTKDESLISENAWEAIRAAFEITPNLATNIEEGQFVACKYEDKFERAKVVSYEDSEVLVNLIDLGKTFSVDSSEVFELPNAIRDIPPLFKTDADLSAEEHPEESSELLETIGTALAEDIDAYSGDVAIGQRVAAIFEDDGLYYRAEITGIEGDDVHVFFIDYGNAGAAKIDELKEIPKSVRDIPVQHVVPKLVEATLSTNICDSSFQSMQAQEVITQGETVTCLNAQDLVSRDDVHSNDLKEIPESVRDFPPQLEPEVISVEETVVEVKAKPVETTEETVTSPEVDYEQKILDALAEELSPLKENLTEGSVVAALFKADGLYYRARVKSIHDNEAFVFFIDYGNEDTVDIEDIREVPETIRDIPALFKEEVVEAEELSFQSMQAQRVITQDETVTCLNAQDLVSPGDVHSNVNIGNEVAESEVTPSLDVELGETESEMKVEPETLGGEKKHEELDETVESVATESSPLTADGVEEKGNVDLDAITQKPPSPRSPLHRTRSREEKILPHLLTCDLSLLSQIESEAAVLEHDLASDGNGNDIGDIVDEKDEVEVSKPVVVNVLEFKIPPSPKRNSEERYAYALPRVWRVEEFSDPNYEREETDLKEDDEKLVIQLDSSVAKPEVSEEFSFSETQVPVLNGSEIGGDNGNSAMNELGEETMPKCNELLVVVDSAEPSPDLETNADALPSKAISVSDSDCQEYHEADDSYKKEVDPETVLEGDAVNPHLVHEFINASAQAEEQIYEDFAVSNLDNSNWPNKIAKQGEQYSEPLQYVKTNQNLGNGAQIQKVAANTEKADEVKVNTSLGDDTEFDNTWFTCDETLSQEASGSQSDLLENTFESQEREADVANAPAQVIAPENNTSTDGITKQEPGAIEPLIDIKQEIKHTEVPSLSHQLFESSEARAEHGEAQSIGEGGPVCTHTPGGKDSDNNDFLLEGNNTAEADVAKDREATSIMEGVKQGEIEDESENEDEKENRRAPRSQGNDLLVNDSEGLKDEKAVKNIPV